MIRHSSKDYSSRSQEIQNHASSYRVRDRMTKKISVFYFRSKRQHLSSYKQNKHFHLLQFVSILNLANVTKSFPVIFQGRSHAILRSAPHVRISKKAITAKSHCTCHNLRYLHPLIQPVVTAKASFNMRLSGFHFKDVSKSSMLTEDVLSMRYNISFTWRGEGRR